MNYTKVEQKGDADMCTVFEKMRLEGIAEGAGVSYNVYKII